jgi:hypothetical protein
MAPGVRRDRTEPLSVRVERNRWKFVGFLVAFMVSVVAFFTVLAVLTIWLAALTLVFGTRSYELATHEFFGNVGEYALRVAAVVGILTIGWMVWELSRAEHILVKRLAARVAPPDTLRPTKRVLHDMMLAAGLKRQPRLYILDYPSKVNAFVIGRSLDKAVFGVTRGFAERLTPDEQRAVFSNLMARARALDTLWATAVSVLMGPVWRFREYGITRGNDAIDADSARRLQAVVSETNHFWLLPWFLLYFAAIFVTEALSYGHQKTAWLTGEVADAEGMLLLKDPRSALRALERVLAYDNHVPTAGDAYSQIFYCWAGFGFAPEDDPEMARVQRLREVLGVEGRFVPPAPNAPGWPVAPPAPRLSVAEGGETL